MKKSFLIVMTLVCLTAVAQETFEVRNVTLFDGEKVLENANVFIKNGKVSEVSASNIDGDHEAIDGTGKFLMPALSNAHVHAWASTSLTEAAKAGVLNLMDMHGVEMYQGMMTALKDSTNYATYYIAGAAATVPEGHGTQYGFPTPTLTKPEEAEQFVQDRIKAGVDYVKIIVEPWKATLDRETIAALIFEAHKNKKMAVSHISRVEDAYYVIKNDIDGLVHIWWDKIIEEDRLTELAETKDFFVIPTLLTSVLAIDMIKKNAPDSKFLSKEELQSEAKRLYDAKVPLLTGTDPPNAGINHGTDLYKEMQMLAEAGIPNIDVLKSATSNVADNFKLKDKGYLKKGYIADMILIDGNPMEDIQDISKLETVWKGGKKVNLE